MKFTTVLIWIGTITPALLSIYFIQNFYVNTVYWDEWEIVPSLSIIFGGEDIFSLNIHSTHNEHLPIFPRLLVLFLASISSYNIFLEVFVGWLFVTMTVLVFWFLLGKTYPEVKWMIIPISWLSYSFIQYQNFLFGWASIHWHFTIFLVVTAFYFLNDGKGSIKSLGLFVILSSIATFSHLIGALTWLIGLSYLRSMKRKYFAIIVISFIFIAFSYFLLSDNQKNYSTISTNINVPFEIITFIFLYLANAFRIPLGSGEQFLTYLTIGITFFSIFVIMMFLYHYTKIGKKLKSNIRPWYNLCLFSFFAAIITSIGRVDFGIQEALALRYVGVSNLFLDGIMVMTVVIISYQIKNEDRKKRKKILKGVLFFLLVLLALYIADGYIVGWILATQYHDTLSIGLECLEDYENAPERCLEILYPNASIVKDRAKILEEFCLGPFSDNCS